MNKTMLSTGMSMSMRPADYKRKVRTAMGVQELTKQEVAAVEMHFDRNTDTEVVARILLDCRRMDRNRRAMREAEELHYRYREGIEL